MKNKSVVTVTARSSQSRPHTTKACHFHTDLTETTQRRQNEEDFVQSLQWWFLVICIFIIIIIITIIIHTSKTFNNVSRGSHADENVDRCLSGYDVMWSSTCLPTLRSDISHPSSGFYSSPLWNLKSHKTAGHTFLTRKDLTAVFLECRNWTDAWIT